MGEQSVYGFVCKCRGIAHKIRKEPFPYEQRRTRLLQLAAAGAAGEPGSLPQREAMAGIRWKRKSELLSAQTPTDQPAKGFYGVKGLSEHPAPENHEDEVMPLSSPTRRVASTRGVNLL